MLIASTGCALEDDFCPDNPDKIEPGICGCNLPDIDSDDDGSLDCKDECPDDPEKIKIGTCGCGIKDTDSDNDTVPDCNDECPSNPDKLEAGICGCDLPDSDRDGDEIMDCDDKCPDDPDKQYVGKCGCGTPETGDSDNDGTDDCIDACPLDPKKTETGECGCGIADEDIDENGTLDCKELCSEGSLKAGKLPGACGCNSEDSEDNLKDSDGDGIIDCNDKCPTNRCYFNEECPADPWDEYENKFQIRSACDFEELRNMQPPPQKISIENNINLSILAKIENNICQLDWEPIQLTKDTIIYGKDKTISALSGTLRCSLTNALFEKIEANTSISNLTLDYDIVSNSAQAMLANTATLDYTDTPSKISNVKYKGSIKTDTQNPVGGLIGKLTSSNIISKTCINQRLVIENTYADGISIYATKANDVGGLIGHSECLDYSPSIKHHTVDTIQGQNNVGGFVGYWGHHNFTPQKTLYIESNAISGKDYVGGVFGLISAETNTVLTNDTISISNINNKSIDAHGKLYIGGIIGKIEGGIQLSNITNEIYLLHGEENIGGILGGNTVSNVFFQIVSPIQLSYIKNNIQTIEGSSTIGGIIGETKSLSKLSSIHNIIKKTIQGSINIGGIIGSSAYMSQMNNVISLTPNINGNTSIGGLYGKALSLILDSVDAEIFVLRGKTDVGGLIGSATSVTLKNTSSRANVQIIEAAEKNVGGMIGKVTGPLNITDTVSAASLSQNIDGTQSPSQSYLVSGSYAIKTNSDTGEKSPNLTTQNAYWLKRYASYAITTDKEIDGYFVGFEPNQTPPTIEKLQKSSGKSWIETPFNINGKQINVPKIVLKIN